ncbi:MAG TPA: hypothetical protein PK286_08830 [Devosia sp.]|nr:hypothetical protein [Devosia sp.]
MKRFGPFSRMSAVAGLAIAGVLAVSAPALAGPAEATLLETYVGTWQGRGVLTGAEKETVVCRMTVSKGNAGKVNYSGRCAMAGTTVAVNGTLAYIDGKKRFEAAMTTNAGFSGLAIGKKSGKGIVFDLKEKAKDDGGNDLSVSAAITLVPERMDVDFGVVFVKTGDTIKASIPFKK